MVISNRYKIPDTNLIIDSTPREYVLKVRDLPIDQKPRERLMRYGPGILSLPELFSVILNTGTVKEDVMEMANRIIKDYGEKSIFTVHKPEKLALELGIPIGKACQIVACGEVGRRIYDRNESGFVVIRSAKDVYEYLLDMRSLPKEHLRGLYLNSHNRIIRDEIISIGTVTANIIHPREVFRPAIEYGAVALVLAHNHPSGVTAPSSSDIEVTEQLIQAGKILAINVLDHVIITKNSFVSIKANY